MRVCVLCLSATRSQRVENKKKHPFSFTLAPFFSKTMRRCLTTAARMLPACCTHALPSTATWRLPPAALAARASRPVVSARALSGAPGAGSLLDILDSELAYEQQQPVEVRGRREGERGAARRPCLATHKTPRPTPPTAARPPLRLGAAAQAGRHPPPPGQARRQRACHGRTVGR